MIISEQETIDIDDARYAAQYFIDYYTAVNGDITAYMRANKLASMDKRENSLPGMGPEDDMFSDFSMKPQDMEFTLEECPMSKFIYYLNTVSSHINESSVPGKCFLLMVREKNSGKIVGMIRFGSPTINNKPRNEWLGQPLDSMNPEMMHRFNQSVMMGFVIVPTQPFGFNYLGGKLLAGICCSHEVREMVNEKWGRNICAFETTSLYGSTKSASQYDGMKPFLRYIGLTQSNFVPMIMGDKFQYIHDWFREKVGGELIDPKATSKKMKQQSRMVKIMNKSLGNDPLRGHLDDALTGALDMQEQKRTYVCTYGHTNVPDYLTLKTDTLNIAENYERFALESVTDWWKKKATKRYDTLKAEGRLRTKLETWNANPEDIDIIR
jgi:hypothetical protein